MVNRSKTRQWHPSVSDALEERKSKYYYAEYVREGLAAAFVWSAIIVFAASVVSAVAIARHGAKVDRMTAAVERLSPVAAVAARVEAACAKANAAEEGEVAK